MSKMREQADAISLRRLQFLVSENGGYFSGIVKIYAFCRTWKVVFEIESIIRRAPYSVNASCPMTPTEYIFPVPLTQERKRVEPINCSRFDRTRGQKQPISVTPL